MQALFLLESSESNSQEPSQFVSHSSASILFRFIDQKHADESQSQSVKLDETLLSTQTLINEDEVPNPLLMTMDRIVMER